MNVCFKSILNFKHQFERKKIDNQKSKSSFSAIRLSLTLMVAAFWVSSAAVAAEQKMVMDPTSGEMVTAPEYGGILTIAKKPEPPYTDSWSTHGAGIAHSAVVEKLADGNWGIDRNEHDFKSNFVPLFALKGHLAESWEIPDKLTIVFHIRQDVHWHDKAPMNGRALTAEDVVFNFHRLTDLGSGFSEPSPYTADITAVPFESITATDKNTVVFKLKRPSPTTLLTILDSPYVFIQPPEVIKQHGDVKDWRNLVGTGSFMLTEWVEGSTMTWVKNPDYWGTDEKYPQNRLPYVDELRAPILPENSTRLAAGRWNSLWLPGHFLPPVSVGIHREQDELKPAYEAFIPLAVVQERIRQDNPGWVVVSRHFHMGNGVGLD